MALAQSLEEQVLSLRQRAVLQDQILEQRLDQLVPALMRRSGIDAWVLIAREYNEDPVLKTMLPSSWVNARRLTVLMFIDRGGEYGVERLSASRYAVGDLFRAAWDPEQEPNQYARIAEILAEANPRQIALNFSDNYGLADGLTYTAFRDLVNALPESLRDRIVSAEPLAVGWLETRTPAEIDLYRDVVGIAHGIIKEGFSADVIDVGQTSAEDLEWWYRERANALGLVSWFHPSIDLIRSDESRERLMNQDLPLDRIYRGDHIHIDFGITYLGLNSDTQQNAYVLRSGEQSVPAYLQDAMTQGNRLQDILTSHFKVGRSGNDILKMAREQAIEEGIDPSIYTHPIGLHGHAAGTTIGMWDKQEGVPGSGDYPMHANTAYSIELTAFVSIPEWSVTALRMALEEDGFYDGSDFEYIQPRQTEYHVIRPD